MGLTDAPADEPRFSNSAAANWTRDAAGSWSRYAADLAQQRADQPVE